MPAHDDQHSEPGYQPLLAVPFCRSGRLTVRDIRRSCVDVRGPEPVQTSPVIVDQLRGAAEPMPSAGMIVSETELALPAMWPATVGLLVAKEESRAGQVGLRRYPALRGRHARVWSACRAGDSCQADPGGPGAVAGGWQAAPGPAPGGCGSQRRRARRAARAGGSGMSISPAVAKSVWTEADFDAMGSHDNAVHAVALEPVRDHPGRLLLDRDYIVEWVSAEPPATTHTKLLDLPGHAGFRPGVGSDRRHQPAPTLTG